MEKLGKHCMTIYGVYAVGMVTQLVPVLMLPGLLLLIIGFILNVSKKFKNEVKGTPFETHQRWMSRTFWIGTSVLTPIAMVLSTAIIIKFTDVGSALSGIMSGADPDAAMGQAQNIMGQMDKASMINTLTMIPVALWWVRRCWIGYEKARISEPIENVTSWV